jgi:hypothetical protein
VSKYSDRPSAIFASIAGITADRAVSGSGAKTVFQLESSATALVAISEVVRIAKTCVAILFMNGSSEERNSR